MDNLKIPRAEHPNPQFERKNWINLNGEWEFERDREEKGLENGFIENAHLAEKITVPFCMESKLSGIEDTDFCECVWYKKAITLYPDFTENRRVVLHIGACDFLSEVYINGKSVGTHAGGFVSFSFDITDSLCDGENIITIRVTDRRRSGNQPSGKQSFDRYSSGCSYTRTTGIWQTVWLESIPREHIIGVRYYPNIYDGTLTVVAQTTVCDGAVLRAEAFFDGKSEAVAESASCGGSCTLVLKPKHLHLWDVGCPNLYDLHLTLTGKDGEADSVQSYFGMRNVCAKDGVLYINGRKVFQRLVLDQGFYPDGIYTAPDETELEKDILRSLDMGFNGARLHQKIFEPRFLYYCDKHGYIVWGEHGDWGLDTSRNEAWKGFIPEWTEAVCRDFNHPAIIGWCPLNEVGSNRQFEFVRYLYELTKSLDPTRPAIDVSGFHHISGNTSGYTDFVDWHDYDQDIDSFRARYESVRDGNDLVCMAGMEWSMSEMPIRPTFISEYGGARWDTSNTPSDGWGYGNGPKTPEEFMQRFKGLTESLLNNPYISGLCYTQLTDVEQEVNGLYTYDRVPKFDPSFFREVLSQKAAIED